MSDILNTVLLGIIEGITEFLPISSTGHLLVAERWLGERSELFNVAIQAGAILAIVLIYWRRIVNLLTRFDDPQNRDYVAKLIVAFLITSVLGLIATRLGWKLPETVLPVALAFLIGGILILLIEHHVAGRPPSSVVTWKVAFFVGACQILAAIFPGTSRSAATIFAAMLVGLTFRPAATEFAFLVGIPTMFAATGTSSSRSAATARMRTGMRSSSVSWSRVWSPSSPSSGCCAMCSRTASRSSPGTGSCLAAYCSARS